MRWLEKMYGCFEGFWHDVLLQKTILVLIILVLGADLVRRILLWF